MDAAKKRLTEGLFRPTSPSLWLPLSEQQLIIPDLLESSRRSFQTNTSSSSRNVVFFPNPNATLPPPTSRSVPVRELLLLSTRRCSRTSCGHQRSLASVPVSPRTVESSSKCMSCLLTQADISFLDAKDQNLLEYKLDTFSSVYRSLAGKDVHFE